MSSGVLSRDGTRVTKLLTCDSLETHISSNNTQESPRRTNHNARLKYNRLREAAVSHKSSFPRGYR
jgi:hypothetical protein